MQGDYNQYECGLTVAAATAEDDGEWECDFESYVKVILFILFFGEFSFIFLWEASYIIFSSLECSPHSEL